LRQTNEVSESLNNCFNEMEAVASEANLLERSLKKIWSVVNPGSYRNRNRSKS